VELKSEEIPDKEVLLDKKVFQVNESKKAIFRTARDLYALICRPLL